MTSPQSQAIPNISNPVSTVDKYGLTRNDNKWLNNFLLKHAHSSGLLREAFYQMLKRHGKFEANQQLHKFHDKAVRNDLWLTMDDQQLRDWCKKKAKFCRKIYLSTNRERGDKFMLLAREVEQYGLEFPLKKENPLLPMLDPLESAFLKIGDESWWRAQVRTLQNRELDDYGRSRGIVNAQSEIYCTEHTVRQRQAQKKRNRNLMDEMLAVNQQGDQYTLQELADLSVSNPAIRRAELMVRMRGFEDYAERLGYVAEFYTITCPSRYHVHRTIRNRYGKVVRVEPNENYDGSSVRDAHNYLVTVGARIRADLHRRGISPFGFRVAEPHHDGCPHWHYLVFVPANQQRECRRVFRHHAIADTFWEKGARKYRFKAVAIDEEKGSATGYLAKYIAKNIDGEGVDGDCYGHDARESAGRIDAWASCYRIRQFQQIGGPSVSVWRELRRLDEQDPGLLETARLAADSAKWADYCALMGSGRDQPIKLAYWQPDQATYAEVCDPETGEISPPLNKYLEPIIGRVLGLLWGELESVCTRFYSWSVSRVTTAFKPWLGKSRVKEGVPMLFGVPGSLGFGANAPPWSSVNNCTGPVGAG